MPVGILHVVIVNSWITGREIEERIEMLTFYFTAISKDDKGIPQAAAA